MKVIRMHTQHSHTHKRILYISNITKKKEKKLKWFAFKMLRALEKKRREKGGNKQKKSQRKEI